MYRLRVTFYMLVGCFLVLLLSSWNEGDRDDVVGPLPPVPVYADSTQWYIVDRGGEADLFYVISTETGDHMMGTDTCHLADTYDPVLRKMMAKEMVAVDSFYSGRLNYYSPYYRQVSMNSWTTPEKAFVRLEVPLEDVKRSWQYYLEHFNHGRPFILAGFSQGARFILDVLKEMPDSIFRRMVATYFIGYKVTQEEVDSVPNIRLAQGATDTGVTVSFNSVRSPECVLYISEGTAACINPVNWRTDSVPAQFINYGRKRNDTLSVWCDSASRHLIVSGWQKETIMPVIGRPGNYHHMELRFYYPYIRQNMADRLAAFKASNKSESASDEASVPGSSTGRSSGLWLRPWPSRHGRSPRHSAPLPQ